MMADLPTPLIVYDGYCALCHGFVAFVLKKDKNQIFYFTSRDSEIGKEVRRRYGFEDIESILLYDGDTPAIYSTASLKILQKLGFPYSFMSVFLLVPSAIRDFFYHCISKLRYRLFGKKDYCYMPGESAKERFV